MYINITYIISICVAINKLAQFFKMEGLQRLQPNPANMKYIAKPGTCDQRLHAPGFLKLLGSRVGMFVCVSTPEAINSK